LCEKAPSMIDPREDRVEGGAWYCLVPAGTATMELQHGQQAVLITNLPLSVSARVLMRASLLLTLLHTACIPAHLAELACPCWDSLPAVVRVLSASACRLQPWLLGRSLVNTLEALCLSAAARAPSPGVALAVLPSDPTGCMGMLVAVPPLLMTAAM
jgi:hypothetical protein